MGLFGPPNIERMKTKRDVKGLVKALGDQKDTNLRKAAAEALEEVGDARAVKPLIDAIKDSDFYVREAAMRALVRIGTPAVETLITAFEDPNWSWGRAGDVLAKIGDARAIKPMIAKLKNSGWPGDALAEFGAPAVEPLIAALQDRTISTAAAEAAGRVLVKIGIPAFEPLSAALNNGGGNLHLEAKRALISIGDAPALSPLIAALKNSDWKALTTADVTQAAVDLLIKFFKVTREGFYRDSPGWKAVREIGGRLDALGGLDRMLEAHRRFASQLPQFARNLEIVWTNVGNWQG